MHIMILLCKHLILLKQFKELYDSDNLVHFNNNE